MQGTSGHDAAFAGLMGAACAWAVAGLFLWLWYDRSRFVRLLRDVPTVPIKGIVVGLTETRGTVEHDEPLAAGITGTACVWHQWSVSEHWRRTQRYKDQKGVWRTRIVTGSDVVASGGEWTDLRLRDDTGAIVVRAKGADWTPTSTFQRTVGMRDPLYRSKAPGVTVDGSTGQRTYSESAVPVGAVAWVMGNARVRPDGEALEIGDGAEEGVFMISLAGERSHSGWAWFWAGFGLVAAAFAAMAGGAALAPAAKVLAPGLRDEVMLPAVIATGALAYGCVTLPLWGLLVRNGAIRVRTRWERAASLVDVELKRRSDLIPNLAAVAQAGAVHERHLQQCVAALRAGNPANDVCRVLAERYPALQADGAFLMLQRQLSDTEERIALARRFEIESRKALIERLQTFPQGTMARIMGVAMPPPPLRVPPAPARPPA